MIEVGRVCYKIAGKEAGRKCVIVDLIDENFVLVDGLVKRRRANIKHLELTPQKVEIKKGASTKEVIEALKKANLLNKEELEYLERKEKFESKKAKEKPKEKVKEKTQKGKEKPEEKKGKKKEGKKRVRRKTK